MKMSRALPAVFLVSVFAGAMGACGSDSKTGGGRGKADASAEGSTGGKGGSGANAADAGSRCGDGIVSSGESCDTGIAAGEPGSCPTLPTCDDGNPCTRDAVANDGTCTAACEPASDTAPDLAKKDACCPAGATAATDADCSADCGNGKLDADETCDTAIASGKDACPTSCADDGDPCTKEALVTADPCNPACKKTTITTAKNGDGCCPTGANGASDDDCTALCGNAIVEPGEDCEGTSPTCSSCKFVPTAFRMTTLTLLDPHTWFNVNGTCLDITAALNSIIQQNLTGDLGGGADGGANGKLDLSFALLFRPLDESTGAGSVDFLQPLCDAPYPPASCGPNAAVPAKALTYANKSTGTCLDADPTHLTAAYTTPSPATAGPNGCFVSDEATLTLPLGGIDLTFEYARMAAQWVGDPATGLVEGLCTGFMSVAKADAILLPASLPLVGGHPLSDLFPPTTDPICTGIDDRDTGPDGTTRGWWWHLSFAGSQVPWTK